MTIPLGVCVCLGTEYFVTKLAIAGLALSSVYSILSTISSYTFHIHTNNDLLPSMTYVHVQMASAGMAPQTPGMGNLGWDTPSTTPGFGLAGQMQMSDNGQSPDYGKSNGNGPGLNDLQRDFNEDDED